ncbi:flagellar protein FlgN [Clostridium sp. HMP27]|uniref:flagellar protein FlgN n=1 Tax=Clostridium sp. HMP27 TaxID=1487921 RepID=UPI00052E2E94|nr:flagellar protein FlgN [Clostridium sp. HMP27]KGK86050.1 flagellar biosynthesis protein FlgN [Clostridium sp. HMP27]
MDLKSIVINEKRALETLLERLEKQHKFVVKNDVFNMDSIVRDINESLREIASIEMERRNLTTGKDMSKIVEEFGDEELEREYREIKKLLHSLELQKSINELLIKQSLSFTNKMLQYINPDRSVKTYGAYGKMKK